MLTFKKLLCEFIGTAILVFCGCCGAVYFGLSTNFVMLAVSFAVPLIFMCYVFGPISGCHLNPAVSLAQLIAGNIKFLDFILYVIVQVIGGFAGCGALYAIMGTTDYGVGATVYDGFSVFPMGISSALLMEIVLTFIFVLAVLAVGSKDEYKAVSGIVCGLTLGLVNMLGSVFTGPSVNPARSIAPAVISKIKGIGDAPLNELWIYVLAPLLGAAIAALVYILLLENRPSKKAALAEADGTDSYEKNFDFDADAASDDVDSDAVSDTDNNDINDVLDDSSLL